MTHTRHAFPYLVFRRATCAAMVCLLCVSAALCAPAEKITFTFNPPSGLVCTDNTGVTQVTDLGRGARTTDVVGCKSTVIYTNNADGHLVSWSTVKAEYNGRPAEECLQTLAQWVAWLAPATYKLDQNGKATQIYGIEEFVKLLEKRAAKSTSPQVAALLPDYEDRLKARAMDAWNDQFAPFVCRSAQVGGMWKASLKRLLPTGGSVMMATKIRFLGWVSSGGKRWLKVQLDARCTDPAELRRYIDAANRSGLATGSDGAEKTKFHGLTITMTDCRLIDPTTMLYLSQCANLEVKLTTALGGSAGRSVDVRERFTRQLSYQDQTIASR